MEGESKANKHKAVLNYYPLFNNTVYPHLWFPQTINYLAHMLLWQLALYWHLKLLLLVLVKLTPNSGKTNWMSFIVEVKHVFWLSSERPFALFIIWSILLILSQVPIPKRLIIVEMAKCPIWQMRTVLNSVPMHVCYLLSIISCIIWWCKIVTDL